jgi:hypothetical protein
VRPLSRPARRALAISAAIGLFDRTPHHTSAVGTAAAAAPVDAEAMDTAAIHTTASLAASAAGTKRARSPSREGGADAQGTSAEADAASDSDEADVCCPGVTRAEVVVNEGGELYTSDVGGATAQPARRRHLWTDVRRRAAEHVRSAVQDRQTWQRLHRLDKRLVRPIVPPPSPPPPPLDTPPHTHIAYGTCL